MYIYIILFFFVSQRSLGNTSYHKTHFDYGCHLFTYICASACSPCCPDLPRPQLSDGQQQLRMTDHCQQCYHSSTRVFFFFEQRYKSHRLLRCPPFFFLLSLQGFQLVILQTYYSTAELFVSPSCLHRSPPYLCFPESLVSASCFEYFSAKLSAAFHNVLYGFRFSFPVQFSGSVLWCSHHSTLHACTSRLL